MIFMITLEAIETYRTATSGDSEDMQLKRREVKVEDGKGRSNRLTE